MFNDFEAIEQQLANFDEEVQLQLQAYEESDSRTRSKVDQDSALAGGSKID